MTLSKFAFVAAITASAVTIITTVSYILNRKRNRFNTKDPAIQHPHQAQIIAFIAGSKAEAERYAEITNFKLTQLIEKLQTDQLDPLDVLKAYQHQAALAHQRTNCVCVFFHQSQQMVKKLVERYGNKPDKPPLYGVPVSVKNYPSTRGYWSDLGCISKENAAIVDSMIELGAIPFCHTNLPQTLLNWSTSNPIYGTTSHPLSRERSPAGSSGGEGALVGCGGSILGIGSDVGGSIRLPAFACGITGFKPTKARISQNGSLPSMPGRPVIAASLGPMARDVDSLILFMKYVCSKESGIYQRDRYVVPLQFDETVLSSGKKLTVGWYDNNGYVTPQPACIRALHQAKQVLQLNGHQLVEFKPPVFPGKMLQYHVAACSLDGGKYIVSQLDKTPDRIDPTFQATYHLFKESIWYRKFKSTLLNKLRYLNDIDASLGSKVCSTSDEVRHLVETLENFKEVWAHAWNDAGIDVLITPLQCVALPHGYAELMLQSVTYTCVFNMLDYPAGVIPTSKVTKEDVKQLNNKTVKKHSFEMFSRLAGSDTEGYPVGVQVVAPPFREETCLRIMKDIENGL